MIKMFTGKRVLLTMQQRLDALKDLETHHITDVAKKYGVHTKTIKRMRERAAKIYNFAEKGKAEKRRKNLRQPKYEELEGRLYTWFAEMTAVGDHVSDALLVQKAWELNKHFGFYSNFRASHGWLCTFKKRHHIRLLKIYRKEASADEHGANLSVSNFKKYIEEENIDTENIYNMDETGLLWKVLPSRTLVVDTERSVSGYKMQKDRLMVGLCANASGTNKITPLVIYKFEKPRALKDCMNQLPIIFKAQTNAWINQAIFVDWFENHFKKEVRQYQLENKLCGKVILIVDNCSSHKFPSGYEHDDNFEVKFLPPNNTSLIQPMDQGVIEKLKRRFRYQVSQYLIEHGCGPEEFFKKYTLKDCLHAISASWKDLTCSDIRNAWKHIIPNMQAIVKTEEDTIISDMQQVWSHISKHNVTVEDIENYFTECSFEELRWVEMLEETAKKGGDEEMVAEEEDEERVAEEGDEDRVADEGDEERVAEEGDEEKVAEEGDEERVAEEGDEERVAKEGDEERAVEERYQVKGIKLSPKKRKAFKNAFQMFKPLKKYLPPPLRCVLKGLQLQVLGYTMSKKRKLH